MSSILGNAVLGEMVLATGDDITRSHAIHAIETVVVAELATARKVLKLTATEAVVVYTPVYDVPIGTITYTESGISDIAIPRLVAKLPVQEILTPQGSVRGPILFADGTEVSASESISVTDKAVLVTALSVGEVVAVTDSATAAVTRPVKETIEVTDAAECVIIHKLVAEETITVEDRFMVVVEGGCAKKLFTPFSGSLDFGGLPAASEDEGFLLQFPATEPSVEVKLRSPNFGNVHRLSISRIHRTTRGGRLVIYSDPMWPKVESLLVTISGLSRSQADALKNFYRQSLGKPIRLVDHENRAWVGLIEQPNDPVVCDGRGCRYTASFEFRGERDV